MIEFHTRFERDSNGVVVKIFRASEMEWKREYVAMRRADKKEEWWVVVRIN